jgi:hypothetical protein
MRWDAGTSGLALCSLMCGTSRGYLCAMRRELTAEERPSLQGVDQKTAFAALYWWLDNLNWCHPYNNTTTHSPILLTFPLLVLYPQYLRENVISLTHSYLFLSLRRTKDKVATTGRNNVRACCGVALHIYIFSGYAIRFSVVLPDILLEAYYDLTQSLQVNARTVL